MKNIYIGTSGYSYPHWKGIFYPESLPQSKWLKFYSQYFNTLELNVTFYRLLEEAVFSGWYKRTPKNFLFAVKGSRFITHIKKLNNTEDSVKIFMKRALLLKEKLGVVLWQFPRNFKFNKERLAKFLKTLSHVTNHFSQRHALEFRDESWFNEGVYELLKKYNTALVIADSKVWPKEEIITAGFTYIRFHGGRELYGSNYSDNELKSWALKIKKWQKKNLDIYTYFNNDACGYAIGNAKFLKNMLRINY